MKTQREGELRFLARAREGKEESTICQRKGPGEGKASLLSLIGEGRKAHIGRNLGGGGEERESAHILEEEGGNLPPKRREKKVSSSSLTTKSLLPKI